MKRITGILLALMACIAACEGPMGPPGEDGYAPGLYVNDFTVFSEDWELYENEDGPYFEYEFAVPELTRHVFDTGAVVCYLVQEKSYDGRTSFLTQNPLPYTYYGMYDDGVLFSENYSYEVSEGYITFIAKNNTFDNRLRPLNRDFHVVIMWQ
jgi:hypothetical protein